MMKTTPHHLIVAASMMTAAGPVSVSGSVMRSHVAALHLLHLRKFLLFSGTAPTSFTVPAARLIGAVVFTPPGRVPVIAGRAGAGPASVSPSGTTTTPTALGDLHVVLGRSAPTSLAIPAARLVLTRSGPLWSSAGASASPTALSDFHVGSIFSRSGLPVVLSSPVMFHHAAVPALGRPVSVSGPMMSGRLAGQTLHALHIFRCDSHRKQARQCNLDGIIPESSHDEMKICKKI